MKKLAEGEIDVDLQAKIWCNKSTDINCLQKYVYILYIYSSKYVNIYIYIYIYKYIYT